MAKWRRARSLDVLEDEIQSVAPGTTVWDIGDQDHAERWSDHNPNAAGVVCAVDVLPNAGLSLARFVNTIVRTNPPALKYVIYNRRIWHPGYGWDPYRGSNPHTGHAHVSAGWGPDGRSTGPYDDTSPWGLRSEGVAQVFCNRGEKGPNVQYLQYRLYNLGYSPGTIDSDYGDKTSAALAKAVLAFNGKKINGRTYGPAEAIYLDVMWSRKYGGAGTQGPAGPRGPAGPQGPAGPAGDVTATVEGVMDELSRRIVGKRG
jgi:hypothetical protein